MIKAVLIDDEEHAVMALKLALAEYCPEVRVIGEALNAKEGIRQISEQAPDLVFLDIQMPHTSGIELLESFGEERNFEVIFVTAFNDFAIRALRLSAMDYLLKPVSSTELSHAVKRFAGRKERLPLALRAKKIRAAFAGKIALPTASGSQFVAVDEIVRIQADGSYSQVHFKARKAQLVSRNLKEFQQALESESFLRVHKSHLVNLHYVVEYIPLKGGGLLRMSDNSEVEISRTQKPELSRLFTGLGK